MLDFLGSLVERFGSLAVWFCTSMLLFVESAQNFGWLSRRPTRVAMGLIRRWQCR